MLQMEENLTCVYKVKMPVERKFMLV